MLDAERTHTMTGNRSKPCQRCRMSVEHADDAAMRRHLGEQPLDILCVEGAIVRGPGGTGMYDTLDGRPKKDLVTALARRARYVIAAGTCASFGGISAGGDIDAVGLQFQKSVRGGFLGAEFTSAAGAPVINLPGCPCHCEVIGVTQNLNAGPSCSRT
jgi:Ni,Fe-hydrogenase I small subunit